MPPGAEPDIHAIRSVLLELAGFDRLRVALMVREGDQTDELCGSPVQLLGRLDEYTEAARIAAFSFPA